MHYFLKLYKINNSETRDLFHPFPIASSQPGLLPLAILEELHTLPCLSFLLCKDGISTSYTLIFSNTTSNQVIYSCWKTKEVPLSFT